MVTTLPLRRLPGVLALTGSLQRAVTAHQVQTAYLAGISEAVGACGHGFYVLDPSDLRPSSVVATVPDRFLDHYEEAGRQDDPVLDAAVEGRIVADSSRLSKSRPWQRSAAFRVLQDAGFAHSLEAPVLIDGDLAATLNMARATDAKPFSRHDVNTMHVVADQVGAALTRARRYEQLAGEALVLADALDAAPQPIVVITIEGQLIYSNRLAGRPLPDCPATYIERGEAVLTEALAQLRKANRRVVTVSEHREDCSHGEGCELGSCIATRGGANGFFSVKAVRLRSRDDAVVAFLSHRPQRASGLPDHALPLSQRERQIADMVSSGLTNRQIAELSYVSENTIKQHMKRIFGKMNVSSRAELVQAVWRSSRGNADSDAADRSAPEESC
jgi:DNA-binding CsgD family transcriptional regulator/PAS domain-containing protein